MRVRVRVRVGARRAPRRREGRRRQAQTPVAPGAAPVLTWGCCAPAAATATSKRWRDSQLAPRPPASSAGSVSCPPRRRSSRAPGLGSAEGEEMCAAAAPASERGWKSEKVDEAQALARSCAARRPDFQPCDGLSICATHSHGKCFKLHWCCHLGWCHCKSSLMSPPFAAVPGRPPGRPGSRQGLCGLGGSGLGRGLLCRRPGPPWGPGGGNCPRAGPVGSALPWQRDEIRGEPSFSHFYKRGSTCPRKMGHIYI